MVIQFVGHDDSPNSRIYKFNVTDPCREARKFTVEVESTPARPGTLKLQDGPSICFDRLRHELESETPESYAKSRLRIGEQDVQEYLARQHPKKRFSGRNHSQPIPRIPT